MTLHATTPIPPDPALVRGALDLVSRAVELSRDHDQDVQALVREAAEHPLPEPERERLFTRIATILLNGGVEPDEQTRAGLAASVRQEVTRLLGHAPADGGSGAAARLPTSVPSSGQTSSSAVTLIEKYGLVPKDVVPIPTFKGVAVAMREGYVDVTTINLWKGNHRVELFVEEFREREGREPEDHELLAILQGDLVVGGVDKDDPFEILPLARSVAAKGVERPPILTWDGEPKDGNRRIAAAKLVLTHKAFERDHQARERARWVRVWVAPPTTDDVIEAIVVALNFESDFKMPWEEYVKARQVVGRYRSYLDAELGRFTPAVDRRMKQLVADYYSISISAVGRYIQMVRWADDFEAYHVEDKGRDESRVRYRANDIFQWFYEIQAGKGADKLTARLDADEELKEIVYDLMFDVLDSGAQVRGLHKVIADESALRLLTQAHEQAGVDKGEAKKLVTAALAEAAKNTPTRKVGFEQFLKNMVDRLDAAPPKHWQSIDTKILRDLRRVLPGTVGAIDAELQDRGITVPDAGQC